MSLDNTNLIIFPGNFLPNTGGLETHVDEFVKYLSVDKKYKITIFTPHTSGGKVREIIYNNVKVIRYPALFLIPNFPIPKVWSCKFWSMFLELYRLDFDVVMTRTRFFTNSFLGLVFAKFRFNKKNRLKLIHAEHGSGYVKVESSLTNFISKVYDNIFGKMIFKFSDKNISISKTVWNFVQKFDTRYSPIITRGVDFEIYNNKISYKLNYDDKLVIGFVGRLYKWKGVENSIKAFLSLPVDIRKNCVFVIVGDGEDFKTLSALCGDELNKSIFMLGNLKFSNAIDVLKQIDIYVHSAFEGGGLSNSLLQAMYCSCAVVASPNEGADEVVINGESGILLSGNSVSELSEGMSILISDSDLREKHSSGANKNIKNNFSWPSVISKYKLIFNEVLK
jgi:glycosyltransferase involved in cell wall biosynthesis